MEEKIVTVPDQASPCHPCVCITLLLPPLMLLTRSMRTNTPVMTQRQSALSAMAVSSLLVCVRDPPSWCPSSSMMRFQCTLLKICIAEEA